MYFPGSDVSFNGNSDAAGKPLSTCVELVAASVTFTGNAASYIDTSGCGALGMPQPMAQIVRLVE